MALPTLLLEGPFESDYSLAIVNRNLARALAAMGVPLRLHQRDNTTSFFPGEEFLRSNPDLAPLFVTDIQAAEADIHSRNIYPPYTDGFRGRLRVMHCYGWEESGFPQQYVNYFNRGLNLVTVLSEYVRKVLSLNGVRVPIEVAWIGADHILSSPAEPVRWMPGGSFDFLHVSSCFPRKAPEVLVDAFCAEFTAGDGVRLIIKTFHNPHNEIERIVKEADQKYPRHAPIQLIFDSLRPAEMRYLYEHAGCLVSASRGEGFGLPAAEAMFLGCPVVATLHSGQADICRPEHCWPVEYELEPARTHLTEGTSVWANPVPASLRRQMRTLYRSTQDERRAKTAPAFEFVRERFTWKNTARRHWEFCEAALGALKPSSVDVQFNGKPKLKVGFVTTWNTRCGIAEYTRHLATSLPKGYSFAVFANRVVEEPVRHDEPYVTRCWEAINDEHVNDARELAAAILASGLQTISIQYNFGFFTPAALAELVHILRQAGIFTAITLHGARGPHFPQLQPALMEANVCICHRTEDINAVRQLGVKHVQLQKQGIVSVRLNQTGHAGNPGKDRLHFVISCFGFLLPPKGVHQLIQAFGLAKSVQPLLRLKLLTSLYPIPVSMDYARRCAGLIGEAGLKGDVEICTAFLDHEETLQGLAESDLVVLPYTYSTESSSAAAAFAIASMKPVLCSDLHLFDELTGVAHRYPAGDVFALANKIVALAGNPEALSRYHGAQEEMVKSRAWPLVAGEFVNFLTSP